MRFEHLHLSDTDSAGGVESVVQSETSARTESGNSSSNSESSPTNTPDDPYCSLDERGKIIYPKDLDQSKIIAVYIDSQGHYRVSTRPDIVDEIKAWPYH